jgi:DNA-binding GntR family transcriptional regulator
MALRRAIVTGELVPDQRLDEQSLADKFAVSRIPIREALALLEHDGLVRCEPRRGTFVVGLTDDNIHDIYEFRRMIEVYAVRQATLTATAEDVARLRAVVEVWQAARHDHQFARMVEGDLAIHRQLLAIAGNKRALASWELMADLIALLLSLSDRMSRSLPLVGDSEDLYRHEELVHLVERHDVEAAEALWRAHLKVSELALHESIKHLRIRGPKAVGG